MILHVEFEPDGEDAMSMKTVLESPRPWPRGGPEI